MSSSSIADAAMLRTYKKPDINKLQYEVTVDAFKSRVLGPTKPTFNSTIKQSTQNKIYRMKLAVFQRKDLVH